MVKHLDLSNYGIRTDLAIEAKEIALEHKGVVEEKDVSQIEGVIIKEKEVDDLKISLVEVTAEGEKEIGKKKGSYLTIEVQGIRQQDTDTQQRVEKVFANELAYFLKGNKITKESSCLSCWAWVIGMLLPMLSGLLSLKILVVTRHLFELQPESVKEGYRPVSAISPG